MKVLILGNGFDLDHNLPTSYKNFLNFCNAVIDCKRSEDYSNYELTKEQIEYLVVIDQSPNIKDSFLTYIQSNKLLRYFNKKIHKTGENWIDFEREISIIVSCFRDLEEQLEKSGDSFIEVSKDHIVHQILDDMDLSSFDNEKWNDISLRAFHSSLLKYVKDFSIALDYYIHIFVNETPVAGVSPDIINFCADRVLTFNYSNTYERIYSGTKMNDIPIHAHGIAMGNLYSDTSIILGITTNNASNNYVEFEKYYQRITKKIGNKYREWFNDNGISKNKIEVAFFGHSLDASDSDIITCVLDNPNTIITVFYYNDEAYKTIVSNLVGIVGKEKLVNFVSGESPKITFVKQQQHLPDSSAGLKISKDIRKIYNFYQYTDKEIQDILDHVSKRIDDCDIDYFFTQSNVISLAKALYDQHYIKYSVKDYQKICTKLNYNTDKNGELVVLSTEHWNDFDFMGDEILCDKKVTELIELVNKSNRERYTCKTNETPLSKIELSDNYENMFSILDSLLSEEPSETSWKNIYFIIDKMLGNDNFDRAVSELRTKKFCLPKQSRIDHFGAVYDEENYYYQMNQSMQESNTTDE